MKIVAFERNNQITVGSVDDDDRVSALTDMASFWRDPAAALRTPGTPAGRLGALDQLPAVPATARIICVGLNYRKHAEEAGMAIPTVPVIFARWAKTLIADGNPAPQIGEKFDWEVELGAVVGRRMFNVTAEQAAQGIFGYVAFNDLSAREYQMQTQQWTLGKNTDASGPISPIATVDEVGDPADGLRLTTKVNGVVKQDSNTADMIFTVPQILAHVSQVMTLDPGDLIITGTPSGVGLATSEFLVPGDEVEIEIERVGCVRTPIIAAPVSIF
jgi:2-keto-4-pentenoate hydratase/2-oxohepta-3-ene-1,7-dioic acid hydratase in catechol pathway